MNDLIGFLTWMALTAALLVVFSALVNIGRPNRPLDEQQIEQLRRDGVQR